MQSAGLVDVIELPSRFEKRDLYVHFERHRPTNAITTKGASQPGNGNWKESGKSAEK
jgi:hypothetical protein